MDELSHAPQYADKDFDYIHFKNKDIFDEILGNQKKRSMEIRDAYVPQEESIGEEEDLNKIDVRKTAKATPEKLMKLREKIKRESDSQDNYNILY